MKTRIAFAIALELAYMGFTRTWLRDHTVFGIERELWVTACRIATLVAYWLLFHSVIRERVPTSAKLGTPWLLLGLAPMFAVPLLFHGGLPADPGARVVYALTSVVVAAREEILYRGVLLNLMARALSPWRALVLSSSVFVVYHYGAQPLTPSGVVELFSWSCVLGIVYLRQGSLIPVIVIHALYDAAWSLPPFVVLNDWWRIPLLLTGLTTITMTVALRSNSFTDRARSGKWVSASN
jgi:membrane protease YdiL (CAAX protease family)